MEPLDVVAELLDVEPGELGDEAGPATVGAWTSLKHIQLVVTLEELYGVSFSRAEIKALTSIGRIRSVLVDKGVLGETGKEPVGHDARR